MTRRRVLRIFVAPDEATGAIRAVRAVAWEFNLEYSAELNAWADDGCEMRVAADTVVAPEGATVTVEFRWAAGEPPPDEWTFPAWMTVLDDGLGEVAA